MAGKNQVTLTFAADTKNLEKGFDNVGRASRDMGRGAEEGASRIDRLGEAGGTTETRFLGLGAGISGVSTLLSGDLNAETAAMAMADLGDAVEHTIAPMVKHAAQWVTVGTTSMVNGAKMAAAWLIGLGPIALVIAGIAAVIAILALLGVSFDDVKNAAASVFNWIKSNWPLLLAILTGPIGLAVLAIYRHRDRIIDAFRGAWRFVRESASQAAQWIKDRFNGVVDFFRGLPGRVAGIFGSIGRSMGNALKNAWNSTIGGRGIHIPSVGVGPFRTPGLDLTIPRLHQGGLMPGAPGTEGLALLQAGERVTRAGAGAGPNIVIHVHGSILSERELVRLVNDELGRRGFGGAFA